MTELNNDIIKDAEETIRKVEAREEDAVKSIHKYFDRIHDKLFAFNNLMIIGYFAMVKIVEEPVSVYFIIVPLLNLILLIFIEYRMMEFSRFSSLFSEKTQQEIQKNAKYINNTNLFSLFSIATTTIVAVIFLIIILFY